jgi:hypothetical protein
MFINSMSRIKGTRDTFGFCFYTREMICTKIVSRKFSLFATSHFSRHIEFTLYFSWLDGNTLLFLAFHVEFTFDWFTKLPFLVYFPTNQMSLSKSRGIDFLHKKEDDFEVVDLKEEPRKVLFGNWVNKWLIIIISFVILMILFSIFFTIYKKRSGKSKFVDNDGWKPTDKPSFDFYEGEGQPPTMINLQEKKRKRVSIRPDPSVPSSSASSTLNQMEKDLASLSKPKVDNSVRELQTKHQAKIALEIQKESEKRATEEKILAQKEKDKKIAIDLLKKAMKNKKKHHPKKRHDDDDDEYE